MEGIVSSISGKTRLLLAVILLICVVPLESKGLTLKIEGSILRQSSEKLVFSLGRFELGNKKEVFVKNKASGEIKKIPLSSIYEDISYSVPLDEKTLNSITGRTHTVYVTWEVEDRPEDLDDKLFQIHEFQNRLRKSLGKEMIADGSFISSRIVIGKIQKFHRIAATLVEELFNWGRENDRYSLFSHPVRFEIEFSPDIQKAFGGSRISLEKATKNLLRDEFERTFMSEFGFSMEEVKLIYMMPSTIKNFVFRKTSEETLLLVPTTYIEVPPSVLNALWYIHRQGIAKEVSRKIRLKHFNDTLLKDKDIIREVVTSAWVIGKTGNSLILSAGKPFVEEGTPIEIQYGKTKIKTFIRKTVTHEYSLTKPLEIPLGQMERPLRIRIVR